MGAKENSHNLFLGRLAVDTHFTSCRGGPSDPTAVLCVYLEIRLLLYSGFCSLLRQQWPKGYHSAVKIRCLVFLKPLVSRSLFKICLWQAMEQCEINCRLCIYPFYHTVKMDNLHQHDSCTKSYFLTSAT